MKNYKLAILAMTVMAAASCTSNTRIEGTLEGAPDDEVVVKLLDVNSYIVLDTVKTDASGRYSYGLDIQEGQPEFIYIFHGDTKVASLLLEAGDDVTVKSDTKGAFTVEGSPESMKLQEVEQKYADFAKDLLGMTESADIARAYISYYRDRVRYISENPKSLTIVPVLFQTIDGTTPIFSQETDALRFKVAVDSLKTMYPDSKYVKALEKEAATRSKYLDLSNRMGVASEIAFPELNMPDLNGKKIALSSLKDKVIFLYFWTSEMTDQTVFNIDYLKPLYEKYHSRGLEIYAVCIDADKALWASIVKNQDLKWINVNDGLGVSSPAVSLYNVTSVPSLFVIENGEIRTDTGGAKDLSSYLDKTL